MAMFENISEFFKRFMQNDKKELLAENPTSQSKETAKDRLHVVLMQDRANVSADFLELMKEEIIEVIKKYIVVDESKIDVRLTNEENEDGSLGAPLLHANIPILNVRNDLKGTYMNPAPSEKIEGQQEINVEANNKLEKVQEETKTEQKEVKAEEVSAQEETKSEEVAVEEVSTEIPVEEIVEAIEVLEPETPQEVQTSEEINQVQEKQEVELGEVVEKTDSENIELDDKNELVENDEDLEEDDDDVTFDDLLKAAEEEEEKLKQLEENKKGNKGEKTNRKNSTPKKKKTSKKVNK